MSTLGDDALLAALHRADDALAAVPTAQHGVPVPWLAPWTIGDLIGHCGHLHQWVQGLLGAAPGERVPYAAEAPPTGEPLGRWFTGAATATETALAADDRTREVATWAGRRPVAWWIRRLAHEMGLHAWDAATATGGSFALEPELAVDGVDELFDVFVPKRYDPAAFAGTGETVHLHATDADGEWLVRFEPGELVVERVHAKGDVAARGPAELLLLLLWSRRSPDELAEDGLEVFGDATVLSRWQHAVSF